MMHRLLHLLTWTILLLNVCRLHAQEFDASKAVAAQVQLDSVVIVATKGGFNVEDFIRLVQEDESLYEAFHNLRHASYTFDTQMAFEDRKGSVKATYRSQNTQHYHDRCRSMETADEHWTGNFFKGRKRKQRYYTYTLYDRLFLTHGVVCDTVATSGEVSSEDMLERRVDALKTLIFKPGQHADVPLIGKKTEIFSEDMLDLYDFVISSDTYHGIPVYRFTATAKTAEDLRDNRTVFKELTTLFSKQDFQVVSRSYRLEQQNPIYLFDVTMQIDLNRIDDVYFPTHITYQGVWNIPLKQKEAGMFTISLTGFEF